MKQNILYNNVFNATKWSTITEFIAKIIVPITNMILARILTPDAFGVVATITMIISFVDMFTDSGFQKYLIQNEFIDSEKKYKSINVAFWTNLIISIILWGFLIAFKDNISILVGNPGLGNVIAISGLSLPLTSFSSIQIAIYKREFDYKTLFFSRIISVVIPFFITIPLAIIGFSYWAIIIGTIFGNLSNAIILTIKSKWKPNFYYSLNILLEMFSFSFWSLIESISVWATSYIGTFLVAEILSSYYLGLYKTTMTTVNGILAIITTATTSILFSSLSRLQNDDNKYKEFFLHFIKIISVFIFPMGIGIFIYRDFICEILLGNQWREASMFVGLWGVMSSFTIVLGQYCSEVYRSKGKPKLSVLAQVLHLIILIPAIYISSSYGFEALIYTRSFVKIQQILVNWIIIYIFFKISPFNIFRITLPSLYCSLIMGIIAYILKEIGSGYIWCIISIFICILIYFILIMKFSTIRKEILNIIIRLDNKKLKSFYINVYKLNNKYRR